MDGQPEDSAAVEARDRSTTALIRAYFVILDQCAPEDGLRYLMALSDAMDIRALEYVRRARRDGTAWQAIADALGMSRQGATLKYGKWVDR